MNIEKSCGAVIFRKRNSEIEFLAVKSKTNGHWGFPKGHMETGESEKETALREVFEETGLSIALFDNFRTRIEYKMADGIQKEVIFFIGRGENLDVQIQQEEISEFVWLNSSDMYSLLTFENTKKVLMEAEDFLNNI